jgi:hypothetical protein
MANQGSSSSSSSGGIGFCGVLAIVFITLKLTGHIDWSWLWVLAPLWIPLLLTLAILACVFVVVAIAHVADKDG